MDVSQCQTKRPRDQRQREYKTRLHKIPRQVFEMSAIEQRDDDEENVNDGDNAGLGRSELSSR